MSPNILFNFYNFPGWHESEKIFTNRDCRHLETLKGVNKDRCKSECLKNHQCTAFNFETSASSSTGKNDCNLKDCPLPVQPPTDGSASARGYYQTGMLHLQSQPSRKAKQNIARIVKTLSVLSLILSVVIRNAKKRVHKRSIVSLSYCFV